MITHPAAASTNRPGQPWIAITATNSFSGPSSYFDLKKSGRGAAAPLHVTGAGPARRGQSLRAMDTDGKGCEFDMTDTCATRADVPRPDGI
jgi:hypothetical protein